MPRELALTPSEIISLIACVGHLGLALLVILRGGKDPVARPLALLCIDLFVWNFATWAYEASGEHAWHFLDVTFSPFTPPLMFHFVASFVGRSRSMRPMIIGAYVGFGLLSVSSAAAFVLPAARTWIESSEWSVLFLVGTAPLLVVGLWLLTVHLREAVTLQEQVSSRLLVAAVVVAGLLGSTELWNDLFAVPGLGSLGTLASTTLIAIIVLRFRLFGRELWSSVPLYALIVSTLAVIGYLAVFDLFATDMALLTVGITSITLALLFVARDIVASVSTTRERRRQLANLGRFSAQMAHDLKNPLAALKGAVQFLAEERAQGRSLDTHGEFLDLIAEQLDRCEELITKYESLSSITPELAAVDVNDLITSVLALPALVGQATQSGVEIRSDLAVDVPTCALDRVLFTSVVENLVHNALEATPEGGVITIGTARTDGGVDSHGRRWPAGLVLVTVSDSGSGLGARERARVFDDFYTTKANGSGLGLAFARRVVEAHEGAIHLHSTPGQGTTVSVTVRLASELTGLMNGAQGRS